MSQERKELFVKALASFLVGEQAKKSIHLQMGNEYAKEWAKLRSSTPLFGYPTQEEAETTLRNFLNMENTSHA